MLGTRRGEGSPEGTAGTDPGRDSYRLSRLTPLKPTGCSAEPDLGPGICILCKEEGILVHLPCTPPFSGHTQCHHAQDSGDLWPGHIRWHRLPVYHLVEQYPFCWQIHPEGVRKEINRCVCLGISPALRYCQCSSHQVYEELGQI